VLDTTQSTYTFQQAEIVSLFKQFKNVVFGTVSCRFLVKIIFFWQLGNTQAQQHYE